VSCGGSPLGFPPFPGNEPPPLREQGAAISAPHYLKGQHCCRNREAGFPPQYAHTRDGGAGWACQYYRVRIRSTRKHDALGEDRLTQEQLARKAEIARETLSVIERGQRDVGIETLARIIKALDATWSEFFEGM
jgi:DNA-binding XRE family transcriptional regulator